VAPGVRVPDQAHAAAGCAHRPPLDCGRLRCSCALVSVFGARGRWRAHARQRAEGAGVVGSLSLSGPDHTPSQACLCVARPACPVLPEPV